MNKTRLEMIVGFFVLLSLGIFFVMVFFISGVYFLREGFHVNAYFEYTGGLAKGAPVRLTGVPVGEVNRVYVDYDKETQKPMAVADLWLKKGTNIREDSKVYILGTYALSEAHVEIMSDGDSEGHLLQDGDSIKGVAPVPMERLIEKGVEITKAFEDLTNKLNLIMGDQETRDVLHSTIIDMSKLLSYMNQVIVDQEEDITQAVQNMEVTLEKLRSILETIDSGEGTLGQLIKNDELYLEMKDLIREIKLHPWRLLKKDKRDKDKKKFLIF